MNIYGALFGLGIALTLVGGLAAFGSPILELDGKTTARLAGAGVAALIIGATLIGATAQTVHA